MQMGDSSNPEGAGLSEESSPEFPSIVRHSTSSQRSQKSSANLSLRQDNRKTIRQQQLLQCDGEEKKSETSERDCATTEQEDNLSSSLFQQHTEPLIRRPLHLTPPSTSAGTLNEGDGVRYYRVIYRGVVALLSHADQNSTRSGCYLSFGEIVKSRFQAMSKAEKEIIRVDEILTGGYAFDPPEMSIGKGSVQNNTETPKRSNVQGYSTAAAATTTSSNASPSTPSVTLAISHSSSSEEQLDLKKLESEALRCQHDGVSHHGFLLCQDKRNLPIVQALPRPPKCHHGRFFYKIMSTTPLPIITGPSIDAPQTKAMALPGSIHEVSFRMNISDSDKDGEGIWFLRLGRRKGYISDRRIGPSGRRRPQVATAMRSEPLVKDVTDEYQEMTDVVNTSDGKIQSITAISTFTSTKKSQRRHRPPRRKMVDHLSQGGSSNAQRSRIHNNNDTNLSVQSYSSDRLVTPSSNVSVLSDDSSLMEHNHNQHSSFSSHEKCSSRINGALSPDRSVARSVKSNGSAQLKNSTLFLMRVTAPRGLKILDAPHFQVNSLIHGKQQTSNALATQNGLLSSGTTDIPALSGLNSTKNQHHLFHTMAGRITTTSGMAPTDNAVIFDSVTKTRILPRGAVFEASKRMEISEALCQGSGLIKLADDSGWVIVPHKEDLDQQYHSGGAAFTRDGDNGRGFEEMGSAIVYDASNEMFPRNGGDESTGARADLWMRVVARSGVHVVCAPPSPPMQVENQSAETSPSSSAVSGPLGGPQSKHNGLMKSDSSEVASSVGSSFLDAMFRAPKRNGHIEVWKESKGVVGHQAEKSFFVNNTVPCGMCVQVESQLPSDQSHYQRQHVIPQEYARIHGGGWIPVALARKPSCVPCPRSAPPVSKFGSYWYRVQSIGGMKVRLGPSKRAPSIKSSDGTYFRFECGEFLRASEILTVFQEDNNGRKWSESFAKLYRNRHVHGGSEAGFRSLQSLTAQAEWVQIDDGGKNEQYLQACSQEPRIERHRQGWRYTVISSSGVKVLKGPSFSSEFQPGVRIREGEKVVVIERVSNSDENDITWLRLKEGGWLHNIDTKTGEMLLVSTSFRHHTKANNSRPEKPRHRPLDDKDQQIAYNTLIARLFHTDGHGPNSKTLV